MTELKQKLESCYTSVLHDVMRGAGLRNFTLPPRIRALNPEGVLTGPAFTIKGRIDETASAHETLLAWTGLLSKARPGHIWVSQPHNHVIAQMGELSAETLKSKGVLGCVVDGALRDTNFILRLGFPCWGTHNTPRDVVGMWMPTATEVPILIDDVLIRPGDWLHGDRDGMIVIAHERLEEVAEAGVAAMNKENLVRKAILSGMDPQEAYLKHGKF